MIGTKYVVAYISIHRIIKVFYISTTIFFLYAFASQYKCDPLTMRKSHWKKYKDEAGVCEKCLSGINLNLPSPAFSLLKSSNYVAHSTDTATAKPKYGLWTETKKLVGTPYNLFLLVQHLDFYLPSEGKATFFVTMQKHSVLRSLQISEQKKKSEYSTCRRIIANKWFC